MNTRILTSLALCAGLALTGCTNTIKYDSAPVAPAVTNDITVETLQSLIARSGRSG